MREQVVVRPLTLMVAGLLIWGAHFALVYAFNAYVCARALADQRLLGLPVVPLGIGVITLAALLVLALCALLVLLGGRPRLAHVEGEAVHGFMRAITLLGLAIATLAVVTQALPAYIVPACA
jgi:hypothetical protein